MWDVPHLVQLKQARTALKRGRLEEAFAIATLESLREYKQCQDLLEDLAQALLERADEHAAKDRLEEALADLERAREAGGNRPELVCKRDEVLARLDATRREAQANRDLAQSVEGHLAAGRIEIGARRLGDAASDDPRARQLERRVERSRLLADKARQRIQQAIESSDLESAIDAAERLDQIAYEEPQSQIVLGRLGETVDAALSEALAAGRLHRAERLLERVAGLRLPGLRRDHQSDVLREVDQVAAAVARHDWRRARIGLERLRDLEPSARWVQKSIKEVQRIDHSLDALQSGPLGALASARGEVLAGTTGAVPVSSSDETRRVEAPAHGEPDRPPRAQQGETPQRASSTVRRVLWVDNVGSFLTISGECITLGRAGSSKDPDIAIGADLDGVHAEIVRRDHDWFVVARGECFVGGRPVIRHLLADGDEIRLGQKVRMRFRQPTSLSSSAVLDLSAQYRLAGDIRRVLLVDGHFLVGGTTGCHVETPEFDGRLIIQVAGKEWRCRSTESLIAKDRDLGQETPVQPGVHMETGSLSFTFTELDGNANQDGGRNLT